MDVKLYHKSPNDVIDIVREIRAMGMVQGKDFDFAYHQSKWDDSSHDAVVPQHARFTFYDDKLATIFLLRWGQ